MEIIEIAEFLYILGRQSLSFFWMPICMWTVLAAGYLLFLRNETKVPPQASYQISTAFILALPLGALLAFAAPFSVSAPEALRVLEIPATQVLTSQTSVQSEAPQAQVYLRFYHLLGFVTVGLLIISLFKLFQLLQETLRINRMASAIQGVLPAQISQSLDNIRKSWGIQKEVQIVFSEEDQVPMTFGWRRAFIVVPKALRDNEEALHMTLIHELAHIRNADFMRQWIEKAIASLFFFHPLVQLLTDKIDQIREMNCDSEVLGQQGVSPRQYASLLLEFASPKSGNPALSISMSADKKNLKRRILAMKDYPIFSKSVFQSRKVTLVVSALLFAICTLIVACEVTFEKDNSITIIEAPTSPNTLPELTVTPEKTQPGESEVFVVVEDMPELIGGLASIQERIKYPAIAKKAGIEGRVFVQFVVDKGGNVVDPVIVRGIGAGCDEEALRAVSQAKFKPGKQRGETVNVKMSIPVTFRLKEETAEDVISLMEEVEKQIVEVQKSLQVRELQLKELLQAAPDAEGENARRLHQEQIEALKKILDEFKMKYLLLQKKQLELEAAAN